MFERLDRSPPLASIGGHGRGWDRILGNVWAELDHDHISIIAAGVAFYSFLAIFPGMSALISLYGLVADPSVIERQVGSLAGILPSEALKLVSDQLHALVEAPPGKLGLSLFVSLLLALWSAMNGTGALMQALSVAYESQHERSMLSFYAVALALTFGIGLFGLVSLFLIAGVPAVIDHMWMPDTVNAGVSLIRWPILAGLALLAMTLLYRFAPLRDRAAWPWREPGTIAATVLWLAASAGFSIYVARFGSYDATYGSLGAVVVLLMWLYLSAYIALAGAELNAEIAKARG